MKLIKDKLILMEDERCENIHSAIGSFVVYEKNAEMNNKYDIKNFSQLIDQFKLDDEVKAIVTEVEGAIPMNRLEVKLTLLDPVYNELNEA